jgi:cytidylate kinase
MAIFKLRFEISKEVIVMYFITVSEMVGTNGEKIAREVAGALNYDFYGEEELFKAADELGFVKDLKKLDEKGPTFLEKYFSEKPKIYLDRLQSVIYEVAKKGNGVFFGRGSQLMLNSFNCAFHVLVTGSTEKRVERLMKDMNIEKEVAERILQRSDQDKRGFLKFAFNEDWLNPRLYDLLLNTDKLSVESAVKMTIDAARSDEIKACGVDAVKLLETLSLHRRIESAILDAGIANSTLFISVEDTDSVKVYGLAHSLEEKETVERIVKATKGVNKITNDLTLLRTSMSGL